MSLSDGWALAALLGLGAWHGINPGMGWLFAVALGLQEGRGRAVWRALPPLAAGHALAVGVAVAAAVMVGRWIPRELLAWGVAACLVTVGVWRFLRQRHPRYGGMRVGSLRLTVWSFLMATAHGAGLMVVPVVLGPASRGAAAGGPAGTTASAAGSAGSMFHPASHADHGTALAGLPDGGMAGLGATLLHTGGYLLVTGIVAALVYRWFGLRWLRTGWVNLDLLWGVALILTGLATPLLA